MGIQVENISKSVDGRPLLDDISFSIDDGAFSVILGPTGSGKTSLLRILAGIDRADRGRILYDGVDASSMPINKKPVAMIYQQFVNYPSLTVFENIASPLRVQKPRPSAAEIERKVRESSTLSRTTR